ncbi:SDR family oxidoreductase [Halorientalis marina]|jgi:NADP-dependent 3-hydroxy acid dehydrogenase YdfG|uniref:SDR family oxidoreductase n=1 Tax=Halorientalis marina TaxID=2931976 RepID=UPI001FF239B3|nr:SDR family oxidoreductase [Halorientalis marina]
MMPSLNGKTVIITGASTGIGRATAVKLANRGANISLAARSEDKLDTLSSELTGSAGDVLSVPTDVRDEQQVQHLFETTVDKFGKIDVLISNAGISLTHGKELDEINTEEYQSVIDTNLNGTFFMVREALAYLREQNGTIIFIGSGSATAPRPEFPIYAATKWWLRGFAHSIEAREGKRGISIVLINPSEVRTEIGKETGESLKDQFDPGEALEPEEVANAVEFALSQEEHTTISELNIYRQDKLSDLYTTNISEN